MKHRASNPFAGYFVKHVGSGISKFYRGVESQRGHGIGSFLGGVLPYLTRGAKAIGKETAKAGLNVLDNLAHDVPIKTAFKKRFGDARDNLKRKAEEKFENVMSGSGYKPKRRKRKSQSSGTVSRVRKLNKGRRKKKTKRVLRRHSVIGKVNTRDIFN
ncbi:hypothetical protein B566_EDAN017667 [Ephemera danica]|nr:hypothetical protein B566_EDAN017667 [Ephemera danica]